MTAVAAPPTKDVGRARGQFVRHPAWLAVPLLIVFVLAFLYPLLRMGEVALLRGDVVDNVTRLIDTPLYVRVLGRTFQIALMVALVTVALAYPLAAFISRRSDRVQALLLVLLFVPMLTSVVVRAYSWVTILRPNGVLDGIANMLGLPPLGGAFFENEAGILIGMVHLMLPFAALPLYAAFRRLDPQLPLAAATLGASPARQWLRIVGPLTLPSALAAFVLVFITTLGFVITPSILGGPRALMLGVLVQRQMALNDFPFAGVLSITLLATTLITLILLRLAVRRFRAVGLL
ncbi:MAG TPA: ABC transporter permease [Candidatus Limnocylindrales bacterium]|nr:ABC transporter permease [Candidatus Limnocylindrales bacterium]